MATSVASSLSQSQPSISERDPTAKTVSIEPAGATFDPQPTETHPKKQVANVIVRNLSQSKIVFRITCRHSTRYTIRPYVEYLEANEARDVFISIVKGDPSPGRIHRFHIRTLMINPGDGVGMCPSAYWMEKVDDGTVAAKCDKSVFAVREPGTASKNAKPSETPDFNDLVPSAAQSFGMNTATWDDVDSEYGGLVTINSGPLSSSTQADSTHKDSGPTTRVQLAELGSRVAALERILQQKAEEGGFCGFLSSVFEFQLKAALVGFAVAWALFATIVSATRTSRRR